MCAEFVTAAVGYGGRVALEIAATAEPGTDPLVVLDRVEAFLDARGLGEGRSRRADRRSGRIELQLPARARRPRSSCAARRGRRCRPRRTTWCARRACSSRSPSRASACRRSSPWARTSRCWACRSTSWSSSRGTVVLDDLPPQLDTPEARRAVGFDLVDNLAEIHAVDIDAPDLQPFVRPSGYLERQVRRWQQLWDVNGTRELPVPELAERVAASSPSAAERGRARRLPDREHARRRGRAAHRGRARLEMGAIGDPRADVGYLVATYRSPAGRPRRSARRRPRRPRVSPPVPSCSRATRSAPAGRSSGSAGSRRSPGGRRRSSAKRSTAATRAASSARRRRRRGSRRECRAWSRRRSRRWTRTRREDPRAAPPGSTIGIVTPASPAETRSSVQQGTAWWEAHGYRVKLLPGALEQDGWHAGGPELRARDIQEAFADPEIDAIQTMRGGYG